MVLAIWVPPDKIDPVEAETGTPPEQQAPEVRETVEKAHEVGQEVIKNAGESIGNGELAIEEYNEDNVVSAAQDAVKSGEKAVDAIDARNETQDIADHAVEQQKQVENSKGKWDA